MITHQMRITVDRVSQGNHTARLTGRTPLSDNIEVVTPRMPTANLAIRLAIFLATSKPEDLLPPGGRSPDEAGSLT